jgi:dihydrofolate reductase
MINAIVAVDDNWGIGYNGDLLEHIPEDLKFFKSMTTGKTVVMGLNTWESLPVKPLPHRYNIVIKPGELHKEAMTAYMDLATFTDSLDDSEIFVIGGGSIYRQLLPFCDHVYITKIYKEHENVDVYFPNLDITTDWNAVKLSDIKEHNGIMYQFWRYDRNS